MNGLYFNHPSERTLPARLNEFIRAGMTRSGGRSVRAGREHRVCAEITEIKSLVITISEPSVFPLCTLWLIDH